jgi:hypothetical protein
MNGNDQERELDQISSSSFVMMLPFPCLFPYICRVEYFYLFLRERKGRKGREHEEIKE